MLSAEMEKFGGMREVVVVEEESRSMLRFEARKFEILALLTNNCFQVPLRAPAIIQYKNLAPNNDMQWRWTLLYAPIGPG
jgi:hypothetical protein